MRNSLMATKANLKTFQISEMQLFPQVHPQGFSKRLSPMMVHFRNLFFFEHTSWSNVVNSKAGKHMKRCEIVIHK